MTGAREEDRVSPLQVDSQAPRPRPSSTELRKLLAQFDRVEAADLNHEKAVLDNAHPENWRQPLAKALLVRRAHLIVLRGQVAGAADPDIAAKQSVLNWINSCATGLQYLVDALTSGHPKVAAERARAAKRQFTIAHTAAVGVQRELR
jgi:hypothetical protein